MMSVILLLSTTLVAQAFVQTGHQAVLSSHRRYYEAPRRVLVKQKAEFDVSGELVALVTIGVALGGGGLYFLNEVKKDLNTKIGEQDKKIDNILNDTNAIKVGLITLGVPPRELDFPDFRGARPATPPLPKLDTAPPESPTPPFDTKPYDEIAQIVLERVLAHLDERLPSGNVTSPASKESARL